MVLHTKVSSARRALVGVVVAALFLACISLQTHIFWSAEEVGAKEQKQSWISATHPSKFSFVIKLLTYDRLHSLARCLDSLTAADYGTQVVKLHLYIDHFPYSDISLSSPSSKSSLPSEAAIEKSLKESHALLDYVDRFTWIHGPKEIQYRIQNAGLQGQWLEAWWPTSDNEFAFVVEDDMYLSPLYFKYLTRVIETYYYNPSNYDPTVYGISLQRPRFVPDASRKGVYEGLAVKGRYGGREEGPVGNRQDCGGQPRIRGASMSGHVKRSYQFKKAVEGKAGWGWFEAERDVLPLEKEKRCLTSLKKWAARVAWMRKGQGHVF
ncbi:hypothetical protein L7F22_031599 [Adiantum nelumboides]|nr:hypothetical protein [Adiantum nelumboides]